jgi:hypothetical protein
MGFITSLILQNHRFVIGFFATTLVNYALNYPSQRFLEEWGHTH